LKRLYLTSFKSRLIIVMLVEKNRFYLSLVDFLLKKR